MNKKIYVYMLNEGTDVWRLVEAEEINGLYKILSKREIEVEDWEFETGDIVKCIKKTFQNGKTELVAIEKIDSNKKNHER